MKILIFGDIYGRVGRNALKKEIIPLKEKYAPDLIIANVDNITSGRGPIEKHILEIKELGIDLMTGGDHIFDNEKFIIDYLNKDDSSLIRPANFYNSSYYEIPGKGYKILNKNGKRILVIHLLGEVFMKYNVYNPFLEVDKILKKFSDKKIDTIIIDFHKEATAEGYGMLSFIDSKIGFLYGTHTHIQTNDDYILESGTGFLSDIGMIGSLNSVIGADFTSVRKRFLTGIMKGKIKQSLDNNYILNAVVIDIDNNKCKNIEKIKIKGVL